MKIQSSVKDYYDLSPIENLDKSLIYNREVKYKKVLKSEEFIEFEQHHADTPEIERINLHNKNSDNKSKQITCNTIEIGFCGRIYPAFRFTRRQKSQTTGTNDLIIWEKTLYTYEQISAFLLKLKTENDEVTYGDMYNYEIKEPAENDWNEHLKMKLFDNDYSSWNNLLDTPIFMKQGTISEVSNGIKVNLLKFKTDFNLSAFEFYRIKDSYTAYNELSKYIMAKRD